MDENSVENVWKRFQEVSQTSCFLRQVDVLTASFTVHHQVEQFEDSGTQSSQKGKCRVWLALVQVTV